MSRDFLNKARRVVVKAGTRSLLDESQKPDLAVIRRLLEEIVALRSEGRIIIFVTSGAIGTAVDAEVTILLADGDGLLMGGKVQAEVREVTAAVEAAAGGTTGLGSGGMISKIRCAKTVTAAGGSLLLINGKKVTLREALKGASGTLFLPTGTRLDHRKRWIAHTLKAAGTLTVDAGGAEALRKKGKSLLAVGVTACEGTFEV